MGAFKEDKFSGVGLLIWANGDRYFGDFINGRLHGSGTFISATGQVFSGRFKDDQPLE